jgi:CRP-like cAMP-binding protein
MNMLAIMSLRLRRFARMIEDLSLKEVPGRLATYLLLSSEQARSANRLRLDLTKVQLASLIGTIPETLSRILAKMANQGFIRLDGPTIEILDRDGLTDLAAGQIRLS